MTLPLTLLLVWFLATAGAAGMFAFVALMNWRWAALQCFRASQWLFIAGEAAEAADDAIEAAKKRNAEELVKVSERLFPKAGAAEGTV